MLSTWSLLSYFSCLLQNTVEAVAQLQLIIDEHIDLPDAYCDAIQRLMNHFDKFDPNQEFIDWNLREEVFQDINFCQDGLQRIMTSKQCAALACLKREICDWVSFPSKLRLDS